ncbi:hypothetical protein ABZ345_07115 [Lentzea sp. NPDC005914]|uniref:hypothetical protein n=1 Tax=Lentzea sp. NPDC005914 TaxID=3154572 RepID=UPI0034081B32
MILDENSKGVSAGRGSKGKCVARRGFAVPISKSEMLVTVKGPREMKSESQGAPKPLQLKLHRESTFTDIDYLAGQLFRFTAMSWRRPYPSTKPVTILHSDLIAGLCRDRRTRPFRAVDLRFDAVGRSSGRSEDSFCVNYGTDTALTCGNETPAGRRGSVQVH